MMTKWNWDCTYFVVYKHWSHDLQAGPEAAFSKHGPQWHSWSQQEHFEHFSGYFLIYIKKLFTHPYFPSLKILVIGNNP